MDLKIQVLKEDQELLGHKQSKTTEINTHLFTKNNDKIRGPLDRSKINIVGAK
jgi:hypothetical protein